jgi:hypothetical protein
LTILGSSDPFDIQKKINGLFVECKKLKFGRGKVITGMISRKGEEYDFHEAVKPAGNVEDWLGDVEKMM